MVIRRLLNAHSTVAAYLALIVALGGTAYAAGITGADVVDKSLTGRDIRDETLRSNDINDGAVRGREIADGSVGAGDLRPGAGGPDAYARVFFGGYISQDPSQGIPSRACQRPKAIPGSSASRICRSSRRASR